MQQQSTMVHAETGHVSGGGMKEQAVVVLCSAVRSSPEDACLAILSADSFRREVNRIGGNGNNALHLATWRNHAGIVRALLEAGGDPNILDEESGWSSVHKALYFGNLRVAALLLKKGGDLNVVDKYGRTPLDLLSRHWKDVPDTYERFGHIFAWGNGSNFTLGTGSTHIELSPSRVDALHSLDIVLVAAAKFHSAVLTRDGKVYSWGWGLGGRLGHPEAHIHSGNSAVIYPRLVSSMEKYNVTKISAAKHHTLLCTAQGEVFSMGSNKYGQLGYPSADTQPEPRRVSSLRSSVIVGIGAANKHSVAVSASGEVFTWGSNSCGQLGYGAFDSSSSSSPRVVEALKGRRVIQCAASKRHTMVLTEDGDVLTWGHRGVSPRKVVFAGVRLQSARDRDGNILRFHKGYRDVSKPSIVAICAGAAHSSALTSTGVVLSWRSADPALQVQEIGGALAGKRVVSISAGKYRTAAVTAEGDVYMWEGRADFFPAEGRAAGSGSKKGTSPTMRARIGNEQLLGSSADSSSSSYECFGSSPRRNEGSYLERMYSMRMSRLGSSPSPALSSPNFTSFTPSKQSLESIFENIRVQKIDGLKKVTEVAVGEKHSLALQQWLRDPSQDYLVDDYVSLPVDRDTEFSSGTSLGAGNSIEDVGPPSLQLICEETIAKHMVDPFSVLQVMLYADAAGTDLLLERCATVAALNLDAVLMEHPYVLPDLPENLVARIEAKLKRILPMENDIVARDDLMVLSALEGGLCPTRAMRMMGDFEVSEESMGYLSNHHPGIDFDRPANPTPEGKAFKGPADQSQIESNEETSRLRRLILKKIQQGVALEERIKNGENLDAQQIAKVNQKGVIMSALAALDGGVPHEDVNALLRAASQAVVEAQNPHKGPVPPAHKVKQSGTLSGAKTKRRKAKNKESPFQNQEKAVVSSISSQSCQTPLSKQSSAINVEESTPVKQIGFATNPESESPSPGKGKTMKPRKGGLSMFLRGELEPRKPAWGGVVPITGYSGIQGMLAEQAAIKDAKEQKPGVKGESPAVKKKSQKNLGVKVSLKDYLSGKHKQEQSPTTSSDTAESRLAWAKVSDVPVKPKPSLRTIQLEQEELRAAQRKIPCVPSYSRAAAQEHTVVNNGSLGHSPMQTGFVYGGSPRGRAFVASPTPVANQWYIPEEVELLAARAKPLRDIQEEEHAIKGLAKLYDTMKN